MQGKTIKQKILLFDLDGTLIDSTEAIVESFLKATQRYGINLDGQENKIQKMIGMTLSDMFATVGIPREKLQECISVYRELYREIFLKKTFLLPKVKESFETLPSTYKMGVVTSKSHFFSEKILENLGMLKYFFTLVGIDDVKEPKPSAEPIFKALEGMSYQKKQVYMIGDTIFDMQAAQNAGVIGIGVQGKYEENLSNFTHLVFEDIAKALDYIKSQD